MTMPYLVMPLFIMWSALLDDVESSVIRRDSRKRDVGVGNVLDTACRTGNSLDANAVLRIGDGRRTEEDIGDYDAAASVD
jgi:hypothetical protein